MRTIRNTVGKLWGFSKHLPHPHTCPMCGEMARTEYLVNKNGPDSEYYWWNNCDCGKQQPKPKRDRPTVKVSGELCWCPKPKYVFKVLESSSCVCYKCGGWLSQNASGIEITREIEAPTTGDVIEK